MFIVFYTVKIVYICIIMTFSTSFCLCDTWIHFLCLFGVCVCACVHLFVYVCMYVCMLVPIRQHGVIIQTTTIGTFTSTKTLNPTYHPLLITLFKPSPGALQVSAVLQSCRLLSWTELRQYQPSGICIVPMRTIQTKGSENSLKHYVLTYWWMVMTKMKK